MPEKENSKVSSEADQSSRSSELTDELEATEEGDVKQSNETEEKAKLAGELLDKDAPTDEEVELPQPIVEAPKQGKLVGFRQWVTAHKTTTILLCLVAILAILAAIPWSRYTLAGVFLKQTMTIKVIDSKSDKPVTSATVILDGAMRTTDNKGEVHIKAAVGKTQLDANKKYYKNATQSVLVPILKPKSITMVRLEPTGRQITVTVVNKIAKKPAENISIKFEDTESRTDKQGKAILVVPANKQKVAATLQANGFNDQKVELVVAASEKDNSFEITPSGKLYFLSNLSGKVDVVKANLDGTDRQTVIAGSGSEDRSTVLLAARDWKYLALLSKRDGGQYAKLYLIDTTTDKMTIMDEGNATFQAAGWDGHRFVYTVNRSNQVWQNRHQALKSFDAETGKLATLDETGAQGDSADKAVYETFGEVYIQANGIVYSKNWSAGYYAVNDIKIKEAVLNTVQPDGSGKRTVKSFAYPSTTVGYYSVSIVLKSYAPEETYIYFNDGSDHFYEYEDDKVKSASVGSEDFFNKFYPTYLLSPSSQKTFWTEPRDGKNTLFIGDTQGNDSRQIASLSENTAYGWYTDQYVLTAKNGSELYIMPAGGGNSLKVTDYFKPSQSFPGYGYGYGGL